MFVQRSNDLKIFHVEVRFSVVALPTFRDEDKCCTQQRHFMGRRILQNVAHQRGAAEQSLPPNLNIFVSRVHSSQDSRRKDQRKEKRMCRRDTAVKIVSPV